MSWTQGNTSCVGIRSVANGAKMIYGPPEPPLHHHHRHVELWKRNFARATLMCIVILVGSTALGGPRPFDEVFTRTAYLLL
ncbi:hypothetical protein CDAR_550761 [Caerostris darwini]|uniref:Uncharacterized protein n=1 Tax=Caerostris darwini TaxID=1538125 RepID=A0AAV4S8S8_9ARAC|nr:hypothetical protein CDAR_550761 [Caerostris darwini]